MVKLFVIHNFSSPNIMNRKRRLSFWILLFLCLLIIWSGKRERILLNDQSTTMGSSSPVENRHIDQSFLKELTEEHLKSYATMYEREGSVCRNEQTLDEETKTKFSRMTEVLEKIRVNIPDYPSKQFSGRGIVLTGGQGQLSFIRINLQMMQFTSTRLPIEIWFTRSQVSYDMMKQLFELVPKLDLRLCVFDENQCESRRGIVKIDPSFIYKPASVAMGKVFPYKPSAILSSTFVEVLFLDCDAYLTRDPEELFLSDPMYEKFGALLYPDAYKTRQHPYLWKVLNSSCAEDEYEIDSATMLINKAKVWKGLYATKLINDHHTMFYHFVTDGDKDTFRFGFRLMKVKYYLVMIPCATGTFQDKRFCGHTLCKTDSLAQHIYVNHAHIFKHEFIPYNNVTLGYTRLGLGDPNKNPFIFLHCRSKIIAESCFHILNRENGQEPTNQCYSSEIPSNEIETRSYSLDESLFYSKSQKNRVLITKTNHVMPSFIENLLSLIQSGTNGWF